MRLGTNRVLALVIAGGAAIYLYHAFQIPPFPIRRPVDSDLFPKLLGFLVLGLSVILFFEPPEKSASEEDFGGKGTRSDVLRGWAYVAITALSVVVYAYAMPRLGFVLSSVAICLGLSWLYGFRRYLVSIPVSVGVPLVLYLVLTRLMGIFLPQGILPI